MAIKVFARFNYSIKSCSPSFTFSKIVAESIDEFILVIDLSKVDLLDYFLNWMLFIMMRLAISSSSFVCFCTMFNKGVCSFKRR